MAERRPPGLPDPVRVHARASSARGSSPRLAERAWCTGPASAPGCPRSGRTGCATPRRQRCCAPASSLREVGQVLRHRSSEVTSIYAKVDRRALAALVQPWPGQRHDRARAARRGLPGDPPQLGLQAPQRAADARRVRRLHGHRRQLDGYDRRRPAVGDAAGRGRPRLSGAADAGGARLCALPARHRSGDRDPAARAAAGAPSPPDPAHLHRAGDRSADRRRQDAQPAAAGGDDRDVYRALGLHRAARQRGVRLGPGGRRRGQPAVADPRLEVRQVARGHDPRQHARGASRVPRSPRRVAPRRRPGLRVRLKLGSPTDPQPDAHGVRPGAPSGRRHPFVAGPLAAAA